MHVIDFLHSWHTWWFNALTEDYRWLAFNPASLSIKRNSIRSTNHEATRRFHKVHPPRLLPIHQSTCCTTPDLAAHKPGPHFNKRHLPSKDLLFQLEAWHPATAAFRNMHSSRHSWCLIHRHRLETDALIWNHARSHRDQTLSDPGVFQAWNVRIRAPVPLGYTKGEIIMPASTGD